MRGEGNDLDSLSSVRGLVKMSCHLIDRTDDWLSFVFHKIVPSYSTRIVERSSSQCTSIRVRAIYIK